MKIGERNLNWFVVLSFLRKMTERLNPKEEELQRNLADLAQKKISHTSPLGSALVGKKVGEKFEVEAPVGKVKYEIVAID